jgi:hypothetical protein
MATSSCINPMRQTSRALASTKSACSAFSHESHAALIAHLFSYGDPRGMAKPSVEMALVFYHRSLSMSPISSSGCVQDGAVVFFVLVDERIHTDEHLFCAEMDCLCHEDQENIACLNSWIQDGLMTKEQADRYFRGQVL